MATVARMKEDQDDCEIKNERVKEFMWWVDGYLIDWLNRRRIDSVSYHDKTSDDMLQYRKSFYVSNLSIHCEYDINYIRLFLEVERGEPILMSDFILQHNDSWATANWGAMTKYEAAMLHLQHGFVEGVLMFLDVFGKPNQYSTYQFLNK